MRASICLPVFLCAFFTSPVCQAGGFFRRVPEVGEWARYECTSRFTYTSDDREPDESPNEYESHVLFKCVGEEMIDNQPHLWIEYHKEYGSESSVVMKYLVPEDFLREGTLTEETIRGWRSKSRITDPEPFDVPASTLRLFFGELPITATRREERTIVVDGVSVTLTHAETTRVEEQRPLEGNVEIDDVKTRTKSLDENVENVDRTVISEAVWWPNEELAFGIGSADWMIREIDSGMTPGEMRMELRFDLVATGTDAVSDLPDHN